MSFLRYPWDNYLETTSRSKSRSGWKNRVLFVASLFDNGKPWPSKPMPGGMLYGGVRSPWWTNGGGVRLSKQPQQSGLSPGSSCKPFAAPSTSNRRRNGGTGADAQGLSEAGTLSPHPGRRVCETPPSTRRTLSPHSPGKQGMQRSLQHAMPTTACSTSGSTTSAGKS